MEEEDATVRNLSWSMVKLLAMPPPAVLILACAASMMAIAMAACSAAED